MTWTALVTESSSKHQSTIGSTQGPYKLVYMWTH